MNVIHATRAVLVVLSSIGLLLTNVACKDDKKSAPVRIVTSGGSGDVGVGGIGGPGGDLLLFIDSGGDGAIDIDRSGKAPASFTPSTPPAFDPGPNGIVIDSDVTVVLATVEPALGVLYAMANDPSLYESDDNGAIGDEPPISSIEIESTGRLVLPLNIGVISTAGFDFSHDVLNDGLITTVDASAFFRGSLLLTAESYRGSGAIETFGELPGQSGGSIGVEVRTGNGYNSGHWRTFGADDPVNDGGDGGPIHFTATAGNFASFIENTGDMDARGGSAIGLDGIGGGGGIILIQAFADVSNSGDLTTTGGDGIDLAGGAGTITLETLYVGEVRNTGHLEAAGGWASNAPGGPGGQISLVAVGSDVRSSGCLHTYGGDAVQTDMPGGPGGGVQLAVSPGMDGVPTPAGDIWLSGAIDAGGGHGMGTGGDGGPGGPLRVAIDNSASGDDQSIFLRGYSPIEGRGGDAFEGGPGALFLADVAANRVDPRTGPFTSQATIDVSGGDAEPTAGASIGGPGGNVVIQAGTISYGTVDVSGGTGFAPGPDGTATPET